MRNFLSRPVLLAYAALALVSLGLLYLLAPLTLPTLPNPTHLLRGSSSKSVGLHFLLPSTSTNNEACKLLFTSATLGYPDPVFLGWEGHGRYNGTKSHLFKLSETLAYLNTLEESQDDDLVLLLDAFDIWLQLPPSILISRYFRAMDRQNARLKEDGLLSKPSHDGTPIYYSILFGADKLCWPKSGNKPACWSAPLNPMPNTTFGPETDADPLRGRPQYLNSGSMLGPVKDVRELFAATLAVVDKFESRGFVTNSDQYYLAAVWHEQTHDGTPIYYSILFGADKLCWPKSGNKPACWSAPLNPMPNTTFGPETDADPLRGRPQYLNSGSMLGPVKDVRELFAATLAVVDKFESRGFVTNSDQYYLAAVWHEQEAERMRLHDSMTGTGNSSLYEATDVYEAGERTEYHLTVDHSSDAFLVNAWYTEYMTWMTFNHSVDVPRSQRGAYNPGRLDRLQLPEDVLSSPGPYSAGVEGDGLPIEKGWKDVMLSVNTVSGEPFPLYHVTGFKVLLGWRWPRMWFHPHGEALLKAARRKRLASIRAGEEQVVAEVRGTKYMAVAGHKGNSVEALRALDEANTKGGAWTDQGAYVPWSESCQHHEKDVFLLPQ
nr:hypothetical protein CFP56_44407 [Quercus suber]